MPRVDFANVTFGVEDGHLVMDALARTGRRYRHTCPLESFEAVARELDAAGPRGLTRADLHERTGIAWTRIQVALLFLDERSIVAHAGRRGRIYTPATAAVLEDAMTEYHALLEKPADA